MSVYTPKGAVWEATRQRVLARDGWICQHCGKPVEGFDATVDHVLPISLEPGRDYADDELLTLCRSCNSIKGDRATVRQNWFNPRWLERL